MTNFIFVIMSSSLWKVAVLPRTSSASRSGLLTSSIQATGIPSNRSATSTKLSRSEINLDISSTTESTSPPVNSLSWNYLQKALLKLMWVFAHIIPVHLIQDLYEIFEFHRVHDVTYFWRDAVPPIRLLGVKVPAITTMPWSVSGKSEVGKGASLD